MKLIFDDITSSSRLRELEKQADDKIHVRGFNPTHDVPIHLRNTEWLLPFNEIPIKYCPTDRYSHLRKYNPNIKRQQSWEMLKGKILDELYDAFIKELHKYLNTTKISSVNIISGLQNFSSKFLSDSISKIHKSKFLNPPSIDDTNALEHLIEKTLRYEIGLASAFLDYRISVTKDLSLGSTPLVMFPFVSKPSYTVNSFGITDSAQPDFVYDNRIIIDIKSPPWNDDFLHTLGGYALVYEKANNTPMNLGMIITPEHHNQRNVPHLFKSEIILIEDIYRKGFLLRRDTLLEMMSKSIDPGLPKTDTKCRACGYYKHCWQSS